LFGTLAWYPFSSSVLTAAPSLFPPHTPHCEDENNDIAMIFFEETRGSKLPTDEIYIKKRREEP
jgi:hypothetical protein